MLATKLPACDRQAAAQLIPSGELAGWIEEQFLAADGWTHDLESGKGPDDVAAAWGVTRLIAVAAIDNLNRYERQRGKGRP